MSNENREIYGADFISKAAKTQGNFLKPKVVEDKLFNYINGVKSLINTGAADDLDIVLMLRFIRSSSPKAIRKTLARFKVSSLENRLAFAGFNAHEKNPLVLKSRFMKVVLKCIGINDKKLIDYIATELNHKDYKESPKSDLVEMVKNLNPKKKHLLEQKLGRPLAPATVTEYLNNPKIIQSLLDYIDTHSMTDLSRFFDQAVTIAPFKPDVLQNLSTRYESLFANKDKTQDSEIEQLLESTWNEFNVVFNQSLISQISRKLSEDNKYDSHKKNTILSNKLTPLAASFIMKNDTYKTMMENAFISFYSAFVYQVGANTVAQYNDNDFAKNTARFAAVANRFIKNKLTPKVAVKEVKTEEPSWFDRFKKFVKNAWDTFTGWFSSEPSNVETPDIRQIQEADTTSIRTLSSEQFKQAPAPKPRASSKGKKEEYPEDGVTLTASL